MSGVGAIEQPEPPNPYEVGLAIDAAVELLDRLEAAERERDALRAALEKSADWNCTWGPYPETNEAWRAMALVTAREAVRKEYF